MRNLATLTTSVEWKPRDISGLTHRKFEFCFVLTIYQKHRAIIDFLEGELSFKTFLLNVGRLSNWCWVVWWDFLPWTHSGKRFLLIRKKNKIKKGIYFSATTEERKFQNYWYSLLKFWSNQTWDWRPLNHAYWSKSSGWEQLLFTSQSSTAVILTKRRLCQPF